MVRRIAKANDFVRLSLGKNKPRIARKTMIAPTYTGPFVDFNVPHYRLTLKSGIMLIFANLEEEGKNSFSLPPTKPGI